MIMQSSVSTQSGSSYSLLNRFFDLTVNLNTFEIRTLVGSAFDLFLPIFSPEISVITTINTMVTFNFKYASFFGVKISSGKRIDKTLLVFNLNLIESRVSMNMFSNINCLE